MNIIVLFVIVLLPIINKTTAISETTCEVTGFYEAVYSETGAKVLTSTGELAAVDILLKPAKPEEGSYDITITRKAPNLYLVTDCSQPWKIVANKFYIETKYCNEYASYDKATLVVTGNFGEVKGKVNF